jgi:hypothetical protein
MTLADLALGCYLAAAGLFGFMLGYAVSAIAHSRAWF